MNGTFRYACGSQECAQTHTQHRRSLRNQISYMRLSNIIFFSLKNDRIHFFIRNLLTVTSLTSQKIRYSLADVIALDGKPIHSP